MRRRNDAGIAPTLAPTLALALALALAACGDDSVQLPDIGVQPDQGVTDGPRVDAPTKDGAGADKQLTPDQTVQPDGPPPVTLTWTKMTSGTTYDLKAVWGSGPKDVWAVGSYATILRYDGTSWKPQTAPVSSGSFKAVAGSGNTVMVAGYSGVAYLWDGSAWKDASATKDINGLWAAGPKLFYAACDYRVVLRYDGSVWTDVSPPGMTKYMDYNSVHGTGPNNVWVVGSYGFIKHYDGVKWSSHVSSTSANFYAVAAGGPSSAVAVGASGLLAVYNGKSWIHMSSSTNALYGVAGSGPSSYVAAGYSGEIFHYNGYGYTWSPQTSPTTEYLRAVWAAGPKEFFIVGDDGTILHGK